jgi:hypothetical protein
MATLYTKNGRPLQRSGDKLWSRSGVYLGKIRGDKVYDPQGQYAGTIVGNRVVYRRMNSGSRTGGSNAARRAGRASASAARSAVMGDEPNFPD